MTNIKVVHVYDDIPEFEMEIERLLDRGYIFQGPMMVFKDYMTQMMIKIEPAKLN